MRTVKEKELLIKAVDSFIRKFIVVSPEFKILAASCQQNEIPPSEIVGKYCYEVLANRSSPCENCAVIETLENGKHSLKLKIVDDLDLNVMPCYYSYPIYSGKDVEAYVSMDFDIPTRGGLEQKLERSKAFLHNLILSTVDGVIAADKSGKILLYNAAAADIFGYTRDEALTRLNVRDIYPDNNAYEVMRMLRSEEHGGKEKLKSYQVDVISKHGEIIPINLNATIIYEHERELATIGFFHDLREELRIKEELSKTQIQLLQAEKMSSLGKLAAGVAHQLNNPLGGIILFTKLILEEYDLPDGARQDLNRVVKDAERCRDTVKELLEFTRQTRHLLQPHDINQAISRTLFLLKNQALFQNIKIENDLDATLPLVPSDIQQLNHLFMNIILNAAQAMEGHGKLTIKNYLLPEGNKIGIEIADTGPGIPEDILPHIFEPFYTTKNEGEGTGLGLSLVYSIVENHGGHIKVTSKPGEGTTFIIEMPLEHKRNGGDNIEK
ncbi:MAG: PAS domain S-box protein [Desulfobacterales bacterium]|uniref:histidine kinase n=1 Tax=Candidatus Desulfatibia profunda TaxID=2841695 RepID=A0A8J6TLZ8_9BACT|nr:PAS domain S-box protein [Candidatus Desulfatibia profunda]MBL7178997.1 PAS domain S-box protein [Desulfobacterales bacterium]